MSVRKLTARIFGSLAILCCVASANAQDRMPPADPFAFNPDFRWFEPIYQADIEDLTPKKRANTGWFATYDRLNLYGSRPELNRFSAQNGETQMDAGYGHRYEVGYMLPDENTGFLFSWTKNNVAEFNAVRHEALNRLNEDELDGTPTNPGPPFGQEALRSDSNNLGFNFRFFEELDSLNVIDFDSYELSKTWRMQPLHYGGILEPMVGFRWFRIKDTDIFQFYDNSIINPALIGAPFTNAIDSMLTDRMITENEAITTQLGFKYYRYRDRFTFGTEFRVFVGVNFQSARYDLGSTIVLYDSPDPNIGDDIDRVIKNFGINQTPVHQRNEEFFLGFDVRGDMAYQLTKSITVRCGFQVVDVARGLWRGGFAQGAIVGGDQDQDYLMFGATGGLTLNR